MGAPRDLTGMRFGKWTVVGRGNMHAEPVGRRRRYWRAVCDCGEASELDPRSLTSAHTTSCGCSQRTHGRTNSPEWITWQSMRSRCGNSAHTWFSHYGGRGITVCAKWRDSFENFFADMGLRPTPKHSIDRIDVNGNYELANCRWSTVRQQSRNTRSNHMLEFRGIRRCAAEMAEQYGLAPPTLRARVNRGWSVEAALTTPVQRTLRWPVPPAAPATPSPSEV